MQLTLPAFEKNSYTSLSVAFKGICHHKNPWEQSSNNVRKQWNHNISMIPWLIIIKQQSKPWTWYTKTVLWSLSGSASGSTTSFFSLYLLAPETFQSFNFYKRCKFMRLINRHRHSYNWKEKSVLWCQKKIQISSQFHSNFIEDEL